MTANALERLKTLGIKQRLGDAMGTYPKFVPLLGALALLLVSYVAGKFHQETTRIVANGSPAGEFHGGRLFGSSIAALYKERDARLTKTTQGYAATLKDVNDKIAGYDKRLQAIEVQRAATATTGNATGSSAASSPMTTPAQTAANPATASATTTPALGAASPHIAAGQPASGTTQDFMGAKFADPRAYSYATASPLRPLALPRRGPATVSFPVHGEESPGLGVMLPPGAYVKAKMLTGVAAPEGRPYPVLLQLDYANILPNRRRLDLAGCFMVAKAQGDLSTERLQMQATKMSCVAKNGRMFERDISGFVADDKDNNFAVAGEVVSKQDRVAVMAFLASIVEGVGKAVQQAQTTQQTTALGGSQSVLTGDQQKYIAAGGASDAAGTVAQWYLKEAQNLLPTINVNSGKNVWVVMQESVTLPRSYFKQSENRGAHDDSYNYVTRLLE